MNRWVGSRSVKAKRRSIEGVNSIVLHWKLLIIVIYLVIERQPRKIIRTCSSAKGSKRRLLPYVLRNRSVSLLVSTRYDTFRSFFLSPYLLTLIFFYFFFPFFFVFPCFCCNFSGELTCIFVVFFATGLRTSFLFRPPFRCVWFIAWSNQHADY